MKFTHDHEAAEYKNTDDAASNRFAFIGTLFLFV